MEVRWQIGIDPDTKGAVAVIDNLSGELAAVHDTEALKFETHKGNESFYQFDRMYETLRPYSIGGFAFIEIQQSYGFGSNPSTMDKIMAGYGGWLAILSILGIPFYGQLPRDWKPEILGSVKAPKEESVFLARQLFPNHRQLLTNKSAHHGRADAMLLATYLARHPEFYERSYQKQPF